MSRYKKYKEEGRCVNCGGFRDNNTLRCNTCSATQRKGVKAWQERNVQNGRCKGCGQPALQAHANKKNPLCGVCLLKKMAYTVFGETTRWEELFNKLEAQNHCCAYTGELLVLGDNASLDHILPAKRFPQHKQDIDNLEWVTWRVNLMKNDLTRDEFLATIRTIALNTGE